MSFHLSKTDTGMSVSFIASAVIHLAVFLLFAWWGSLFPARMTIQETYYVDVVDLPTAEPRSGNTTSQKPDQAGAVPLPLPAPVLPMVVPPYSKAAQTVNTKTVKPKTEQNSVATDSDFTERMARLEKNSDARREEAVLERLRSKVKAGKAGAPGTVGTEAGSRYVDYLKSRLEDALKVTSSYTTKNPEIAVRLTILGDGKLSRVKIERSSGDAAFELAVRRAIDLASEKFIAPPDRAVFENGFVFKPKGISDGTSR